MTDSSNSSVMVSADLVASKLPSQEDIREFHSSLLRRMSGMKSLEEQITKLEAVILNNDFTTDVTVQLERKVAIYKTLTAAHVNYIESIRRTLANIDLITLMRAFGILEMYEKFKLMPEASITKLNALLEER